MLKYEIGRAAACGFMTIASTDINQMICEYGFKQRIIQSGNSVTIHNDFTFRKHPSRPDPIQSYSYSRKTLAVSADRGQASIHTFWCSSLHVVKIYIVVDMLPK